ncbi:DEAD/DEAH box helicase [Bacteroides reticulotermitis]|uniref:DEAD/DEAH box helicase n=1 Tax=Bacteroides reticulotermitis TaxID=1133319 RepID=UPI003A84A07B
MQLDYVNLLLGRDYSLSEISKIRLLKFAIIFLNSSDSQIKRFGYRIIVCYSNLFNDYKPLYDVAINQGLIPISSFIDNNTRLGRERVENFLSLFTQSYQANFKNQAYYMSFGQKILSDFTISNHGNIAVVAPTSYGKSELMINKIYQNIGEKICIIVPSKALLAQTKKRIVEHSSFSNTIRRIITHPEMYKGNESSFIAVLTQERLLRLLQKNQALSLDLILIDEAHNMLNKDSRAELLTQVLLVAKKRNPSVVFNFFTPFISDASNLVSPYANYSISPKSISEYIKTEKIFIADISQKHKLFLYDQFLDKHIDYCCLETNSDIEFVEQYKSTKNIVYFNKPIDIQKFALELCRHRENIAVDLSIAINAISEFIHPQYNLISCLSKGIVYHHGGMPDSVRLYVEKLFSTIRELDFIVTNSTLLEGVNIPANRMFLATNRIGKHNLSKSQFKNLIGRVCRFREIFDPQTGNLQLLEPHIYLLKGDYMANNSNLEKYVSKCTKVELPNVDNVENILLIRNGLTPEQQVKRKKVVEYIENIEPNTIDIEDIGINVTDINIAKLCYLNNVHDFDIIRNEEILQSNLDNYINSTIPIQSPNELVNAIFQIFLNNVEFYEGIPISRLINEPARRYYAMLFDWRINGCHYQRMISQLLGYWNNLNDKIIYVGSKWGEQSRENSGFKKNYVDLNLKNQSQIVNLAIVRIKEEQDFIDNNITKYVEILNDLEFINKDFYSRFKYGTNNPIIISLLKNGFSLELAKTISEPLYSQLIIVNTETDEVSFDPSIIEILRSNDVNDILCFEMSFHMEC